MRFLVKLLSYYSVGKTVEKLEKRKFIYPIIKFGFGAVFCLFIAVAATWVVATDVVPKFQAGTLKDGLVEVVVMIFFCVGAYVFSIVYAVWTRSLIREHRMDKKQAQEESEENE